MGLFREQIHLPKSKYSFVGLGNGAFQGENPAQIQIFMCGMGKWVLSGSKSYPNPNIHLWDG